MKKYVKAYLAIIEETMLDEIEIDALEDNDFSPADFPLEKRVIHTDASDAQIDSLYGKYKRGKLEIQPDFQRDYVWDSKRASKLIESAILSIPIPIVYISEEPDNKEHVIDGQQRLTSFFSFIDGKFPDGSEFKLKGLQICSELNGKLFCDLNDEQQDIIRYTTLRTVTFKKGSDESLKFEIFERLNTGSVALNDQELRNCIYRGPYNELIHELARDQDFMYILDLSKPDKRRRDVELVLRFCAFYHATYLNYKPPMKNFLNKEAFLRKNLSAEEAKVIRNAFKNACSITRSMFGKNSFKRFYRGTESSPNGRWEQKKFNASLYDIIMYTFSSADKNSVFANMDSIRESLLHLMTKNDEFITSIEISTSSVQAVKKRFDLWRNSLENIIQFGQREQRCFTRSFKEQLFRENPTCAICGQKIDHVDDAAVDHIEQYWTGGKTIPENARLTHRFCNWSRPKKE